MVHDVRLTGRVGRVVTVGCDGRYRETVCRNGVDHIEPSCRTSSSVSTGMSDGDPISVCQYSE